MRHGKLPATLPLSIMDLEGATYYWLHINRLRLSSWFACGVLGDHIPWQPPADWQLLTTLSLQENLTEVNVVRNNVHIPMAVVLKQGELPRKISCLQYAVAVKEAGDTDSSFIDLCTGGHLVVIIRGTGTGFEGNLGEWCTCCASTLMLPGIISSTDSTSCSMHSLHKQA